MSVNRHAAKIDANQPEIIKALRAVGAATEYLKKPLDLLVWAKLFCPHCRGEIPEGQTFLLEVKNEEGKNAFTKEQVEFMAWWPGKIVVARQPEEAVAAAVGAEAMK